MSFVTYLVQFCDKSLITMRIFSSKVISGEVCSRKLSEIIAGLPKHNNFLWQVLRNTAQFELLFFGRRFQIKDFRVGDCQLLSRSFCYHVMT